MNAVLAMLTAGIGLFSIGIDLVTTGLQESTSRTLRLIIRRSTKSLPSCALLGVLAGAIMQSTSAVTTVLGSMAASGMLTLPQALPIVAFANIGTTVLVFAGAININVLVLFAVGLSGIVFPLTNDFRLKAIVAVVLGIALFLYGGNLVTDAAADIEKTQWFSAFLHSHYGSTTMAFLVGTVASFAAQSTTTVALISVALANAGLLQLDEAITMIYGANLGSTILRILLTRGSHGTLRQISRFQDLFKILGTAIFVLLFVIETRLGVPLVGALVSRFISSLPLQLATVNLLFNGSMALAAIAFARPIERFVARTWPPSAIEDLSVPKYAVPEAVTDPATAIDLLEKEQMRILKSTRDYLALVRPHTPNEYKFDPASLHKSFQILFGEMEHFHVALVSRHTDAATSERLGNVHGREKLLELVEASLHELTRSVEGSSGGKLEPLILNFVEALDFLLMFAGDAARTLDRARAEFVFDLSSDRGEMMAGIRSMYLAPDQALSPDEKALLLRLTNLFERIVWMLQRYAELILKNVDTADGDVDRQPRTGESIVPGFLADGG